MYLQTETITFFLSYAFLLPEIYLCKSCSKNYQRIPGHTACLERSTDVTEFGISDDEKRTIVALHNKLRSEVDPPATNMLKLEWDQEVAMIAQKWAETCADGHDKNILRTIPGRFGLGQNLAWGYGTFSRAIQAWYDEYKIFEYGDKSKNVFTEIGHYTQVVWAGTKLVGCGYTKCNKKRHYVCNYAPGGNSGDWSQPYIPGRWASACPSHKDRNLCTCGACESNSDINWDTCTCECHRRFHVGPNCVLNCTLQAEKPEKICKRYKIADCIKFTDLQYRCPKLCKVCPRPVDTQPIVVEPITHPPTKPVKSDTTTKSGQHSHKQYNTIILTVIFVIIITISTHCL